MTSSPSTGPAPSNGQAEPWPDPDILFDGPEDAPLTVALAHGAGAPMDTPYMARLRRGPGRAGGTGRRVSSSPTWPSAARADPSAPPDRAPVLLETWRTVVEALGHERLIIGGKSLGGRMASMFAATAEAGDAPGPGGSFA